MPEDKKIGQGLHFKVYDLGDKVKKVPTSREEIKETLLRWYPCYKSCPVELEEEAERVIGETENTVKELLEREIDLFSLGNPYLEDGVLFQDKVTPLGTKIKDCVDREDIDGAYEIIDSYIDFILRCWNNSFSEKTYNFTINYGMNSAGKIVLIDFGEISFSKISKQLFSVCKFP